jgi:hypothetical protein
MRYLAILFTRCTPLQNHPFLHSIGSLEFAISVTSVITLLCFYLLSGSPSILLKNLTATPERRS